MHNPRTHPRPGDVIARIMRVRTANRKFTAVHKRFVVKTEPRRPSGTTVVYARMPNKRKLFRCSLSAWKYWAVSARVVTHFNHLPAAP